MRSPLLILLATSALAFTAACGASEEEVPGIAPSPTAEPTPSPSPLSPASTAPTLTPGPGVTLWRWVNVTVLIPDGSGIVAGPDTGGRLSSSGTVAFQIIKQDLADPSVSSYALLDAQNGSALSEEVRPEHRAAMDSVLSTVRVVPMDKATMPWPYDVDSASAPQREFMGFSLVEPSPVTGLYVSGGLADPGGMFVSLTNGLSTAFVNVDQVTGKLQKDTSAVGVEDFPAFERWLATVSFVESR